MLFRQGLVGQQYLKKRENFRAAFDGFDAKKITEYGEEKVAELMQNKGIIRNQLKIRSTISNAALFLSIQQEFGSFDNYIWQFTGGTTIVNRWKNNG